MRAAGGADRRLVRVALDRAGLTAERLWLRAFALGATIGLDQLEDYLRGDADLSPGEHDLVAQALNARLDEIHWRQRVPFTRPVREPDPEAGPLAAIVTLLRGAYRAAPDAIPRILDAAGEALGVRVVLYLVDYALVELVPFPGAHGAGRAPLGLESTMPGRAFRTMTTQSAINDGQARMWVPVLDGLERLGVLDVLVDDVRDLHDTSLREQLRWTANVVGYLVNGMGAHGDAVDTVRRSQPRTVAAELVWQLLPPPDAATDQVVVSARLEPSNTVGGDVFDHSLSERSADLAIVDATGHDLGAGVVSATALAAYRNARREGRSLFEQADAVHRTIREQFGGSTYATGVVARLDLDSGRLRYVAAGHPYPLILRGGHVVRTLRGGRRALFGLETSRVSVGEESLEPGDTVVLYTDGITEARDRDGVPFGVGGLTDFLEREAEMDTSLPEVVRRLCRAILRRQEGVLQDDCTVLLARWTPHAS